MSNAPEPPDQERYWNQNLDAGNLERDGATGFEYVRERSFFLGPEGRYAVRQLGDLKGKSIVDVGAGLGVASLYFAELGAQVHAVDMAEERLQALRSEAEKLELADRITCHHATAEKLPLDDGSVDHVFTKSVLIHTDLERAGQECYRIMKPGGRAVFLEPMAHNPLVNLYRNTLAPKTWKEITNYFTKERIKILAGCFDDMQEKRFHLTGFGAFVFQFALRKPALFHATAGITSLADRMLFTVLPPSRNLAWFTVMTCQKNTTK
jgi:2-polyprenyl-3-methyl-5-hydroxy-6-metoxy-1,4-benzoquinol methylase